MFEPSWNIFKHADADGMGKSLLLFCFAHKKKMPSKVAYLSLIAEISTYYQPAKNLLKSAVSLKWLTTRLIFNDFACDINLQNL